MGSSLLNLRMLDPLLGPHRHERKFFAAHLQSHLQSSPPTLKNSYPKFRNTETTSRNTLKKSKKRPSGGSQNFVGVVFHLFNILKIVLSSTGVNKQLLQSKWS